MKPALVFERDCLLRLARDPWKLMEMVRPTHEAPFREIDRFVESDIHLEWHKSAAGEDPEIARRTQLLDFVRRIALGPKDLNLVERRVSSRVEKMVGMEERLSSGKITRLTAVKMLALRETIVRDKHFLAQLCAFKTLTELSSSS